MQDYYSSTSFNYYRRQDDLKRLSNLVSELDFILPIPTIERPLTDTEIELELELELKAKGTTCIK